MKSWAICPSVVLVSARWPIPAGHNTIDRCDLIPARTNIRCPRGRTEMDFQIKRTLRLVTKRILVANYALIMHASVLIISSLLYKLLLNLPFRKFRAV